MLKPIIVFSLVLLFVVGMMPATAQDTPTAYATITPTPIPRPPSYTTATDGRAVLELFFDSLPQGSAGVARISGEGVVGARMRFLGRVSEFYAMDDGYYVIVPVGLDVTPRGYPITVSVRYADDSRTTIDTSASVTIGGFVRQAFTLPPDLAYLTAPEVERIEYARIESITSETTPERLWDNGGFTLPMATEITSPFGAFRTLNSYTQTRHTGWDFRAAPGTPVMASAAGVIAYAGPMDIRGNYVMIDHGFGVFSGYAHFSQILVTEGQTVSAGQIIGVSGNTGRSSGPHLHWEIAVNGEWVDSIAFTSTWLP